MSAAVAENCVRIKFGAQQYELSIPIPQSETKKQVAESLIAAGLALIDPTQTPEISNADKKQLTFSWLNTG
jgi:hypothetical protein